MKVMVLELSKVKKENAGIRFFLLRIEQQFLERLAQVLFGGSEVKEYEDLRLPSENEPEKQESPSKVSNRSRRRRRKHVQLQLLLFRGLKRGGLRLVVSMEQIHGKLKDLSKSKKISYENTYRTV